jgi:hypothetical protein
MKTMRKHWKLLLVICVLVLIEAYIFLNLEALTVSDRIQAGSIVALVAVTIIYALQTQGLVQEARKKRDADFLERAILLFFRPLIKKLDDLNSILKARGTTTDELNRTIREVQEFINEKRYMVSKKAAKRIELAFVDFIGVAIDEDPASRKGYFTMQKELLDNVLEEWKRTEDKIRKFYGLKNDEAEKS